MAGGFAEVQPDRVIILAEVAEAPEEIDRERAERARQRAELRLSGRHPQGFENEGEIDYNRALDALARALARIIVAGRVRTATLPPSALVLSVLPSLLGTLIFPLHDSPVQRRGCDAFNPLI